MAISIHWNVFNSNIDLITKRYKTPFGICTFFKRSMNIFAYFVKLFFYLIILVILMRKHSEM